MISPQKRLDNLSESITESGCKLFLGHTNKGGYGKFYFNSKTESAHRVAYLLKNGKIPEGKHILHRCDIRCCINPDHLFLGSNQDNVDDKVNKGRSYKAFGQEHPRVKYSNDQILAVKRMLSNNYSHQEIEKATKVQKATISKVSRGLQWSQLDGKQPKRHT